VAVLAPSILSADFARLADEVRAVDEGGAALIHVDVMDGHFVPNLTLGPDVTRAIRRSTELPVDCHLMVERPAEFVEAFAEAGADMISVHVEVERHLHRTLRAIRDRGLKAGVVLNPATPLTVLDEVLAHADYVLLMSVNPGFGGQTFIPRVLDKVRRLRERIERERLSVRIEIDGGVGPDNIDEVAASGVDMIVAGSAVFGAGTPRESTRTLVQRLAELAEHERRC
jgi:ribulose-phosphate 3-epimerase